MKTALIFYHRMPSLFIGVSLILLAACSAPVESTVLPQTPEMLPQVVPTPTQPGGEPLTICLGQEPNSLFPFGDLNEAARQVLHAVFDGPFDELAYQYAPVILEELPTLENGGVIIQQVAVQAGDRVVSEDGTPITLGQGAIVRPEGCAGGDCVLVYENGEVMMDQLAVTFRLKTDLLWSDGTPLTAGDSVFAHRIQADPANAASQFRILRTASYQALDERTNVWIGLPGYINADYPENFWSPAPEHAWRDLELASLGVNPLSAQNPIGWGPYRIDRWDPGQQIILKSNPNYYRAAESLPLHAELHFRFVGEDGPANLSRLQSGECDLLGPGSGLETIVQELTLLQETGSLQLAFAQGDQWLHIDFGLQHVEYDDGYNQGLGDRPNYFADVRTRQAITHCIDRRTLVEEFTWGQGEVMNTFVPQDHPLITGEAPSYGYDLETAVNLLESVGWLAPEGSVRVAQGVVGVIDGTPLEINYLTLDTAQEQNIAELISLDLAECGIRLNVVSVPAETLFAKGPAGPLFGRQFDMAQYAWPLERLPACYLFLSEAVPGDDLAENRYGWGGWNASGWKNLEFDLACKSARNSLPGQAEFSPGYRNAQSLYAENLPVIPLFAEMQLVAARADLCGLDFDARAGVLWNVERLGFGEACP